MWEKKNKLLTGWLVDKFHNLDSFYNTNASNQQYFLDVIDNAVYKIDTIQFIFF